VPQIIPFKKMVKSGHLAALQAEMQSELLESFFDVNFVKRNCSWNAGRKIHNVVFG